MELADWLELGTLLVTLAALGATVWIATRSLRQQAAEAQASLGHHTREALLDRVWERRADLYLDLLDWLADKDDSAFDVSMDAHQEATDSELELLIQQFEDAVE